MAKRGYKVKEIKSKTTTKLKRGDEIIVIAGEDKGKRGKILVVDRKKGRIVVEGVNRAKMHKKPSQKNPQGGITERELPFHASNAMLWDATAKKASRIKYTILENGKRVRIAKASGETLEK